MIGERKELELKLIQPTLTIKRKRKVVADIKAHLANNNILAGNIQSWINDPKELSNLDPRLLCLFAEQIYQKTGNQEINPENYFTEHEIKKARQYDGKLEIEEDLEFPITFSPVIMVDRDKYSFAIDLKTLAKLSASQKLNYNFDIQREAKLVKKGNEVFQEATLHMSNVNDIKKNLISGEQELTTIVLNAAVRTSDSGDELIYDEKTLSLTVTSGTRLDVVDGFHRIMGTTLATNERPDIEGKFLVTMLNYDDSKAAKYQAQLAKATPISKHRREFLEGSTNGDLVVKDLMKNSDLKGRIGANYNQVRTTNNELVSYVLLKDTINKHFKLDKMIDVYDVQDYLKKFFNILLGTFDEFENPIESRKESLITVGNMFVGYLVLASRMMTKGIDAGEVRSYIRKIDFENKELWKEIGVLNQQGNMDTEKSRKAIENYFNNIEL